MGKNTAKPRPPRPETPAPKHAGGGKLLMWGLVGLAVALAAGVAVWSVSSKDGSSTDGKAAAPSTVAGGSLAPGAVKPAETQPVSVTGSALPQFDDSASDPAVGTTPPTLSGHSFDGTPITIKPGTGGPMLVVFFAHWCPHCNRELPVLAKWREAGRVPAGLQVLGVNTGVSKESPNYPPTKWLPTMEWTWPVLADSDNQDAARGWGLPAYPYFVVVGEDGKVKLRRTGEMNVDVFDQMVRDALNS